MLYHFDDNLHEVPNDPAEIAAEIARLKDEAVSTTDDLERAKLLGMLGAYQRIMNQLDAAAETLNQAVELSKGHAKFSLVNRLRLAHVHQWQKDYASSNQEFDKLVVEVESDEHVAMYRDFVYQHAGKNRFDQQDYAGALAYFEKALAIRQEKQDNSLIDSTQHAIQITKARLQHGK